MESLIGSLKDERFAALVNLGKKITDFGGQTDAPTAHNDEEMDETVGVNVQFEESDDEGDEDIHGEVREEDDLEREEMETDDGDVGESTLRANVRARSLGFFNPSIAWLIDFVCDRILIRLIDWLIDCSIDWLIDWQSSFSKIYSESAPSFPIYFELSVTSTVDLQLARSENDTLANLNAKKELQPRDIDAHWLQREVRSRTSFTDPVSSKTKAEEILEILRTTTSDRDVENKLVLLLGTVHFDIIRTLRQHRKMSKFFLDWNFFSRPFFQAYKNKFNFVFFF